MNFWKLHQILIIQDGQDVKQDGQNVKPYHNKDASIIEMCRFEQI